MDVVETRVCNALYEATRYRKRYCREEHAVIFDGFMRESSWGLFVKRFTDTDDKRFDMVVIMRATPDGKDGYDLSWAHEFSTRGMTFAEMVKHIKNIISEYK